VVPDGGRGVARGYCCQTWRLTFVARDCSRDFQARKLLMVLEQRRKGAWLRLGEQILSAADIERFGVELRVRSPLYRNAMVAPRAARDE